MNTPPSTASQSLVKTGMMLGLGETTEQTLRAMQDLVDVGVEVLNLGQYLRPSKRHLPVQRWIHPDEFAFLKEEGERMGFKHVESGTSGALKLQGRPASP